jgi:hypothetical protein
MYSYATKKVVKVEQFTPKVVKKLFVQLFRLCF